MRMSPGCKCCDDSGRECDYCNNVASDLPATLGGVGNNGCSGCVAINGNYILVVSGCTWIATTDYVCGSVYDWYRLFVHNDIYWRPAGEYGWFAEAVRVFNGTTMGEVARFKWSSSDPDFNCLTARTLSLVSNPNSDPNCDWSSAELDIAPDAF